jgi:hypothetical protein
MRHPKPTPEQNAGRVVRKAALVLEDREWGQGSDLQVSVDGVYKMCTRGAINFAVLGVQNMDSMIFRAGRFTKINPLINLANTSVMAFSGWLKENGYGHDTVSWNDTIGRTKEEVIAYMNKFADEKDAQHG